MSSLVALEWTVDTLARWPVGMGSELGCESLPVLSPQLGSSLSSPEDKQLPPGSAMGSALASGSEFERLREVDGVSPFPLPLPGQSAHWVSLSHRLGHFAQNRGVRNAQDNHCSPAWDSKSLGTFCEWLRAHGCSHVEPR